MKGRIRIPGLIKDIFCMQGYFYSPFIFTLSYMQKVCPVVNSPRHDYLMFEYNEKYNSPSLKFPIDNAGKNGEMKMGANTVCPYIQ